jgi:hypothetical protein
MPVANATMYCLKCKTKVDADVTEERPTKNGHHILIGACPVCGTKTSKLTK